MHKKMKGRQRKAAAIILTAALVLSAGPVPSVLAETERFFGDRTAGDTGRRKHGTRDAGTEAPEETEPQTDPVTEQSTETEPSNGDGDGAGNANRNPDGNRTPNRNSTPDRTGDRDRSSGSDRNTRGNRSYGRFYRGIYRD